MTEPPDPFTTFSIAAETHCCAESPDGYLCTEKPGHNDDGSWHRAEDSDGTLYDTWPGDQ